MTWASTEYTQAAGDTARSLSYQWPMIKREHTALTEVIVRIMLTTQKYTSDNGAPFVQGSLQCLPHIFLSALDPKLPERPEP
jgi:hypothetical protein